MNPLLKVIRRGMSVPTNLTAAQQMTGLAYNFSPTAYYADVFPWINLIHTGTGFGFSGDGWPRGVSNGSSVSTSLIFVQDATLGWVPPGDYQVSGSAGFHFDVAGSTGLTNVVAGTSGSPTCTFTIPDLGTGSYGGVSLSARAINHSGASADLLSMYVGKVSSKTLWDGGEIYDPLFLADIAGCSAVRIQGWADQNGSLYDAWDTAELNSEANVVWNSGQGEVAHQSRIPWSVAAKLAKKLTEMTPSRPCILWACLNSGNEKLVFDAYDNTTGIFHGARAGANLPQTHRFTEDQPIVFFDLTPSGFVPLATDGSTPTIYYAHPLTSTTFQLKATPGGTVISGTPAFTRDPSIWYRYSIQPVPETAKAVPYFTTVANQIRSTYPDCMVMVEVGNEPWNSGYAATYYYAHAPVIPAAGGLGTFVGSSMYGWAWVQQRAWKAFETVFGRSAIVRGTTAQTAWFDPSHYAQIYVDPEGIISAGTPMGQLSDVHYIDSYTWASLDGVTEMSAQFDGMNAMFNAGRSTADDATLTADYLRGNSIVKARILSHITQLHSFSPGKPVITYEGGEGSWCVGVSANQMAMMARIKAYLSTTESVSFVNDYVQKCLIDTGIQMNTQYTAAGAWSNPVTKWGLKRAHQLPDTPSAAAFKAAVKLIS